MAFSEFAPAKINLCLHVTGRRADGYHELDSIVAFAGAGDVLHGAVAHDLSLSIGGPFGAGLSTGADNLVLRAARALAGRLGRPVGARLHLDKRLPVASGIGGGSADAAAALRLLARMWEAPADVVAGLPELALGLGADVPVCLGGVAARMRGIGEVIEPVALPRFGLVLVNPGVAVATGSVFRALGGVWSGAVVPGACGSVGEMVEWLRGTGNDLQAPAIALCPVIGEVLAAVAGAPGCRLARMSGSGATCFGVFDDAAAAALAVTGLVRAGWWCWAGSDQSGGSVLGGPAKETMLPEG